MSGSRSRSSTSLLALAAVAPLAACSGGDETCGPGDAPADGITLVGDGLEIRYENLIAGPNNDCPDTSDPGAPTSITIVGTQPGSGAPLTLCLSRPDRFGSTPTPLGTLVVVEDADGIAGECQVDTNKDRAAPQGTAHAEGYCGDGLDTAGFALVVDAQIGVQITCGDSVRTGTMRLSGRAKVTAN